MPTLLHPPIDVDAFLEEVFRDEEYYRRSAAGVRYARGRHGGYDMQRRGQPDTLYAVADDGIIRHRSFGPAFGLQMSLVLPNGFAWFYAHCQTRVADGTRPRAGETIGRMGTSGGVEEHVHFEGRRHWGDWTSAINIGDDLRDLQRRLRAGEKPWLGKDWFEMATKEELEAIVERVVERKVSSYSGWLANAVAQIVLHRKVPTAGWITDKQREAIVAAIEKAAQDNR